MMDGVVFEKGLNVGVLVGAFHITDVGVATVAMLDGGVV